MSEREPNIDTPLLDAWTCGSRWAQFLAQLGFTSRGVGFGWEWQPAFIRSVRQSVEEDYGDGLSRTAVFSIANAASRAAMELVLSIPVDAARDERFLAGLVYATLLAEADRRERHSLVPAEPMHATVARELGLSKTVAIRSIYTGERYAAECVQSGFDGLSNAAWMKLREVVEEAWPRHVGGLNTGIPTPAT